MGKKLSKNNNLCDRGHHRQKMQQCLDAFAQMLSANSFSFTQRHIGFELELNLLNNSFQPSMTNDLVLAAVDNPYFTSELSQHNIELNVPPRVLSGDSTLELENDLKNYLELAETATHGLDSSLAIMGILPTLTTQDFDQKWLSHGARYSSLNESILNARGEHIEISLEGSGLSAHNPEKLHYHAETILPESSGTSFQLHIQVAPEEFAAYWNAAQCLAGVQVAISGNSPFLLGKALWHETRIPLFLQATDTRTEELRNQGVRPRTWFGERWITSIFDLFEENARYFPGILTEFNDEDPLEILAAGKFPELHELRLLNGTIWRWNRPVYDVADGVPHLRIENRVLSAGPTVLDMMANAAFFYGAQTALANSDRPLWTQMSFHAAEENLYAGARDGFEAKLYWPAIGWLPPDELVLRVLLPLAHDGLRQAGVSDEARERYLEIIEQRCLAKRSGAWWQREMVKQAEDQGSDREIALAAMLERYVQLTKIGQPVHTWPTTF